ncbi:MAG: hypothetical protein V1899_02905 [Planctomycetota bacterium]
MNSQQHTGNCAGCRRDFVWNNYNQVWYAGAYPCCSENCMRAAQDLPPKRTAPREITPDELEFEATPPTSGA